MKVAVGDLVYVYSDCSKIQARQRYLVLAIGENSVTLRRFSAKFIGGKDIEAKFYEIYPVPSIEEIAALSDNENNSTDDEDFRKSCTPKTVQPGTKSKDVQEENLQEDTILSDNSTTSELDEENAILSNDNTTSDVEVNSSASDVNETEQATLDPVTPDNRDPTYSPPAPVTPAVMIRPKRKRKKRVILDL